MPAPRPRHCPVTPGPAHQRDPPWTAAKATGNFCGLETHSRRSIHVVGTCFGLRKNWWTLATLFWRSDRVGDYSKAAGETNSSRARGTCGIGTLDSYPVSSRRGPAPPVYLPTVRDPSGLPKIVFFPRLTCAAVADIPSLGTPPGRRARFGRRRAAQRHVCAAQSGAETCFSGAERRRDMFVRRRAAQRHVCAAQSVAETLRPGISPEHFRTTHASFHASPRGPCDALKISRNQARDVGPLQQTLVYGSAAEARCGAGTIPPPGDAAPY
eukprot:gene21381-biopygen14686